MVVRIRQFATLIICFLAFTAVISCQRQDLTDGTRVHGDYVDIEFRMKIPQNSAASRSVGGSGLALGGGTLPSAVAWTQEDVIDDAYVFFISTTTGKVHDIAKAQNFITHPGGVKSFNVSLNIEGVEKHEFESYVLTNIGSFIASIDYRSLLNITYAQLHEKLRASADEILHAKMSNFVMWGKSTARISATSAGSITIAMLRAVASVNVGVGRCKSDAWDGLDDNGQPIPFTLQKVYIYNAYDQYSFMPSEHFYNPVSKRVTAPTVVGSLPDIPLEYIVTGAQISHQIYLPESPVLMKEGAFSGDENHLNRCAIVLGGLYDNSPTTTYYRLDFNDNSSPKQLVDVLRNHQYTINIVSVTGPGSSSAEEAFELKTMKLNMIAQWQTTINSDLSIGAEKDAVGSEANGGIIFWRDPDDPKGHYKVVAKVDAPSRQWIQGEGGIGVLINVAIGANSMTNGRHNVNQAIAFSTATELGATGDLSFDFPAIHACYNYRGPEGSDAPNTWYLPAADEIFNVMDASDKIAQADPIGWMPLSPKVGDYWSSTEAFGVPLKAWYIRLSTKSKHDNATKFEVGGGIRCVREIISPVSVGEKKSGGAVFWTDPNDPTNYKVVALCDPLLASEFRMYSSPELSNKSVPGAQNKDNGLLNQLALIAMSNSKIDGATGDLKVDFPAAAMCYNYTGPDQIDPPGTWYLPAINELTFLYHRNDGIDIIAPQGWVTPVRNSGYVSSTENSDNPRLFWWVGMGMIDGANIHPNGAKYGGDGRIRCIRGK